MEKILQDFENYKINVQNFSPHTATSYVCSIKQFMKYYNLKTLEDIANVTPQMIVDWLSELSNKYAVETRNSKLKGLKSLYKYLMLVSDVSIDKKILEIPIAKVPLKEAKFLTNLEINQMIRSTGDQRIKCGISILQHTGLRFNEMMQLTCSDIRRGYATVNGKGKKERKVWFSPECLKFANSFINGKRKRIVERKNVDSDFLFLSNNGTLITRESFARSLKTIANRIGIEWADEVSPHTLRHSYITESLNNGVPIQVIRDVVGHSTLEVTNRYSHSNEDLIKQFMLKDNNKEIKEEILNEYR